VKGLKKRRGVLCKKLGIDENNFEHLQSEFQNKEIISDLSRKIVSQLAGQNLEDKIVITFLEEFLADLKAGRMQDELGQKRLQAQLAESEGFGI
tara:strand:- start:5895 stop:6176 length:282 start_codon:yes stop_codon:yes gene_type:complete